MNDYRNTGKSKNVVEVQVNIAGKVYIVAVVTRKISKNEELLTDYGVSYWERYKEQCRRAATIHQLRNERDEALAAKDKLEKQLADLQAKVNTAEPSADESLVNDLVSQNEDLREEVTRLKGQLQERQLR
jgi:hypothetical protein